MTDLWNNEAARPERDLERQFDLLAGDVRRRTTILVERAETAEDFDAYHRLRREVFVREQELFDGTDRDDIDDVAERVVLVARAEDGTIVGGVRIAPGQPDRDLAWWTGSRLVVDRDHRRAAHVGGELIIAACAAAELLGALRFEATVQRPRVNMFQRLGWQALGETVVAGAPHERMRWPIGRVQRLVDATKTSLGEILEGLQPGGSGWVGDDAAPVPGSDLMVACDAILPAMVARDPWWAGWCSVLVNSNDLAAKGAALVGLLDAIGARTPSMARRIVTGIRDAADVWGVPVLGGHTTLNVEPSLAVTVLGRTPRPVPASGARIGHDITFVADLAGSWRPGYEGRQWDSTTARSATEIRQLHATIEHLAPSAAKDVSMAGTLGTLGMLAEANGCGAEFLIDAVPKPRDAGVADWVTCFPGFAMLTASPPTSDAQGRAAAASGGLGSAAVCGRLVTGTGVDVVWPDGETITVISGPVTNLGVA